MIVEKDEMNEFAERVLETLSKKTREKSGAAVLALSGELGAGKTTFVQSLARELGVAERVTSPTFVISKFYKTTEAFKELIHIDAYRLESMRDLEMLGWDEWKTRPHTLIVVEWPEKVRLEKKGADMNITFEHESEEARHVTIHQHRI